MTIEPKAYDPAEARQRIAAAISVVVGPDVALAETLTDKVMPVVSEIMADHQLQILGDYLASLPEQERKAKMFDVLVQIGALNAGKPPGA